MPAGHPGLGIHENRIRDAFKVIENGKGKDKHFQSIMESIYKGLFILAEDWEPEEILPAIAELDEAEIMVKEFL